MLVYQLNKNNSMPFQKGNKLGARKIEVEPLDTEPICFKGRKGQKEKLKAIQN
jgi:hypothetical protein